MTVALLALAAATLLGAPTVAAAPPQSGRLTCTVHTIRFHHGVPTYGCALMRLLPGPYTITEDRCQGGAYSYDLEIDTMYSGGLLLLLGPYA